MTKRMKQLHTEMTDLCHEVDALQEKALHRVEEIENDFQRVVLPDEMKKNFKRLSSLITKV